MTMCRGPWPVWAKTRTSFVFRSTDTTLSEPMTATYAVRLSGETTIPRGWRPPTGMVATTLVVAASTTVRSIEHQLVTRTCLPSGVTATYLGTVPTWTTERTAYVVVSTA